MILKLQGRFLGTFLQKMDMRLFEAINGIEAIEKFSELKPDLTTMDITMPVMDGLQSLKKIIELDKNAKVIMVTAWPKPRWLML